jgi:hypothetical protein
VPFTRPDYEAMRRETSVFTDAFATLGEANLTGVTRIDGHPARAALVSGNFFQVLGVQAALGRPLLPGDDERFAGRPVIVLSHAGWRKLFRADPAVIGRRVVVNGAPYEIADDADIRSLSAGRSPPGLTEEGLSDPSAAPPLPQLALAAPRSTSRILGAYTRASSSNYSSSYRRWRGRWSVWQCDRPWTRRAVRTAVEGGRLGSPDAAGPGGTTRARSARPRPSRDSGQCRCRRGR